MNEIEVIRRQIRRADHDAPWHGPAVREVLAGVSAAEAAAHPVPGAHSIWELVLHLAAWRGEVARRVATGAFGEPPEGDWPVPDAAGGEAAWADARARLAKAEEELQRALADCPPERLDEVVGGERNPPLGTGVTYRVMLHGVPEHDAYHAGQVSLLRKALAAARGAGPA